MYNTAQWTLLTALIWLLLRYYKLVIKLPGLQKELKKITNTYNDYLIIFEAMHAKQDSSNNITKELVIDAVVSWCCCYIVL